MNKNTLVIGFVALVAIVLATIALVTQPKHGKPGDRGEDGKTIIERITDTVSPRLGGVTNFDILNVGTTSQSVESTSVSTSTVKSGFDNNGLFSYAEKGTCQDRNGILMERENPFDATSTVTFASINVDSSGTTTAQISVGTTSTAGLPRPPVQPNMINNFPIRFNTKGFIANTSSSTNMNTASTVGSLILGPDDWLKFFASGTGTGATSFNDNGGVVGGNNTFACTYNFEIRR